MKCKMLGNHFLKGTVSIHGAKNSVLAMIPASLLTNSTIILENTPDIEDVHSMMEILSFLEIPSTLENHTLTIYSRRISSRNCTTNKMSALRASYYFMGALLGRYKKVAASPPGGCNIGKRPIDYHLQGFIALGATVQENPSKELWIENKAPKPCSFYIPKRSFGATINLILASVYIKGVTTLIHPALEPEITDFINYMNTLGFKITQKDDCIYIKGISRTPNTTIHYTVMPDRIEAFTYLSMGLLSGELTLQNVPISIMKNEISLLKNAGANIIEIDSSTLLVFRSFLKPFSVEASPYPGISTDISQMLGVLMLFSNGSCKLKDTIFEDRISSFHELEKCGASLEFKDSLIIHPKKYYSSGVITASDLRGAASYLLFGLRVPNLEIHSIEHLLRGYDSLLETINCLGGKIYFIKK